MIRSFSTTSNLLRKPTVIQTLLKNSIPNGQFSPVQVISHPGIRQLNLSQENLSNPINPSSLAAFTSTLEKYRNNSAVGCLVIASSSSDVFSTGFDSYNADNLKAINTFGKYVSEYPKPIIVVYEGEVKDAGFSVFADAPFRLGTENTRFSIKGLFNGQLPVGNGLAWRLLKPRKDDLSMVRFLGISGWEMDAVDMHSLGLITHFTQAEPQASFIPAIGDTVHRSDNSKQYQSSPIDTSSIGELLDVMHVQTSQFDDILSNPVWNKAMLVTPLEASQDKPTKLDDEIAPVTSYPLESFQQSIAHCFYIESVDVAKRRLEAIANDPLHRDQRWARHTMEQWSKIDPELTKKWFKYTYAIIKKKQKDAIYQLEEEFFSSK